MNLSNSDFDMFRCADGQIMLVSIRHGSTLYFFFYTMTIIAAITAFFTTITNTLVFTTILKSPELWNKLFYKGLCFISVTDFFAGAVALPMFSNTMWRVTGGEDEAHDVCLWGKIMFSTAQILAGFSVNGIFFITTERFFKICYATKYSTIVTNARALTFLVAICAIYIVPVILHAVSFPEIAYIFFGIFLAIFIIVVTFMYYKIFRTVRRSRLRVQDGQTDNGDEQNFQEHELAKKFFVIIFVLLICYTPTSFLGVYGMNY